MARQLTIHIKYVIILYMNNEIESKKKEIEDYKKIILKYTHSRWYNMGKQQLEQLEQELKNLLDRKH